MDPSLPCGASALLQGVDCGGLNSKEVVASVLQQRVLAVVTPWGRLVLDGGVFARVVVNIGLNHALPRADAGLRRCAVHQGVLGVDQFLEISDILGPEVVELEDARYQAVVVIAPVERVLPS